MKPAWRMESLPATAGYRVMHILARPLVRTYFRLYVEGRENVPRSGSFIVCANHASMLDPPVLGMAIPRSLRFLMARAIYQRPWLKPVADLAGVLPMENRTHTPEGFRAAFNVLKRGGVIAMFPEGRRTRDGHLLPFKHGASHLALQFHVPILPVAIRGTLEKLPTGKLFPKPGHIHVTILPPVTPPEGFAPKTARNLMMERVKHAITAALHGASAPAHDAVVMDAEVHPDDLWAHPPATDLGTGSAQ